MAALRIDPLHFDHGGDLNLQVLFVARQISRFLVAIEELQSKGVTPEAFIEQLDKYRNRSTVPVDDSVHVSTVAVVPPPPPASAKIYLEDLEQRPAVKAHYHFGDIDAVPKPGAQSLRAEEEAAREFAHWSGSIDWLKQFIALWENRP